MHKQNVILLLSGGTGIRVGAKIPKQYIDVKGRPLFSYALAGMKASCVDSVQVVAASEWHEQILSEFERAGLMPLFKGFSSPGVNRQLSIYNGLQDIKAYAALESLVMVHDAARPYLTGSMVQSYFMAADGHDGALPVLPMKDTIYQSKDGRVISGLLNRDELFAGQAPEVYRLGKYLTANERLLPDDILRINGAAEPAIMAGMDIAIVDGEEKNFKITTPADLERFREMV